MKVGGQSITCMVDTGAEHSMVTTPVALLTGRTATIVGAAEIRQPAHFARPVRVS